MIAAAPSRVDPSPDLGTPIIFTTLQCVHTHVWLAGVPVGLIARLAALPVRSRHCFPVPVIPFRAILTEMCVMCVSGLLETDETAVLAVVGPRHERTSCVFMDATIIIYYLSLKP